MQTLEFPPKVADTSLHDMGGAILATQALALASEHQKWKGMIYVETQIGNLLAK